MANQMFIEYGVNRDYEGEKIYCCSEVSEVRCIAWTEKNPGRRSYRCPFFMSLKFFDWFDDDLDDHEYYKGVIKELYEDRKALLKQLKNRNNSLSGFQEANSSSATQMDNCGQSSSSCSGYFKKNNFNVRCEDNCGHSADNCVRSGVACG